MFEVYQMSEDENEAANEERLCHTLEEVLPHYSLVIIADYGHGMFTPRIIDLLSREARCLAVNTQANAGNHGFNTVSKYPRANYLCISESEIPPGSPLTPRGPAPDRREGGREAGVSASHGHTRAAGHALLQQGGWVRASACPDRPLR